MRPGCDMSHRPLGQPGGGNDKIQEVFGTMAEQAIYDVILVGDGPGVAGNIVSAGGIGLIPAKAILGG